MTSLMKKMRELKAHNAVPITFGSIDILSLPFINLKRNAIMRQLDLIVNKGQVMTTQRSVYHAIYFVDGIQKLQMTTKILLLSPQLFIIF